LTINIFFISKYYDSVKYILPETSLNYYNM